MTIKLSIPTNCAAYLGETEGMDKLHGGNASTMKSSEL